MDRGRFRGFLRYDFGHFVSVDHRSLWYRDHLRFLDAQRTDLVGKPGARSILTLLDCSADRPTKSARAGPASIIGINGSTSFLDVVLIARLLDVCKCITSFPQ